jgi:hypothetical protein
MKNTVLILLIAVLIGAGFVVRVSNASYATTQAKLLAAEPVSSTMTTQLNALKEYVSNHSGSTVTVELTMAYDDAVQQAQTAASSGSTPSGALYAAAQAACAGKTISTVQAQCNEEYLQTHSTPSTDAAPVVQPKLSDYTYHFVAPMLTLDLATILWAFAFITILVLCLPVLRPTSYL